MSKSNKFPKIAEENNRKAELEEENHKKSSFSSSSPSSSSSNRSKNKGKRSIVDNFISKLNNLIKKTLKKREPNNFKTHIKAYS